MAIQLFYSKNACRKKLATTACLTLVVASLSQNVQTIPVIVFCTSIDLSATLKKWSRYSSLELLPSSPDKKTISDTSKISAHILFSGLATTTDQGYHHPRTQYREELPNIFWMIMNLIIKLIWYTWNSYLWWCFFELTDIIFYISSIHSPSVNFDMSQFIHECVSNTRSSASTSPFPYL